MTAEEQQWMILKDQYSELARAAGSEGDAWFGDPLESHEDVLALLELEFLAGFLGRSSTLPCLEKQLALIDLEICDVHESAVAAHIPLPNP
jgi:hypothetical protein